MEKRLWTSSVLSADSHDGSLKMTYTARTNLTEGRHTRENILQSTLSDTAITCRDANYYPLPKDPEVYGTRACLSSSW